MREQNLHRRHSNQARDRNNQEKAQNTKKEAPSKDSASQLDLKVTSLTSATDPVVSVSCTPEPTTTGPIIPQEHSAENKNLILLKPSEQVEDKMSEVEMSNLNSNTVEPLRVMLIAEGTYPFHWGGVSTWCHLLIRDLPEVNFILYSLVADPQSEPRINLLSNVVEFISVPLWGIRENLELRQDLKMGELHHRRDETSEENITEKFLPIFSNFLNDLYLSDSEPERLGQYIHQMYRYFREYDYDITFHSQATWNCYVKIMQEAFTRSATDHGYDNPEFTMWDVTQGMQWLYHWLFPLARPLPPVDVAHASTAGISTMIGVIAKLEYGAAFLLSEHGIYLRERYLAEAAASNSLFLKLLALRFARRMTDLSYVMSDQISPCCDYNQRWELQNGAPPERLRTIYYGADADKFYAGDKPFGEPPVVVWVGRINPLKDVITLLKAAALVHEERPDIKFKLFGTAPEEDRPYYEECLALHKELGLEDVVIFAGYASNAAVAYNEGDVVLLSSISEGFPFATLEAMLCGKPVVATSVGGLPEQIDGCGVVVEPRNAREMADGVLLLMNDPELSIKYGKAAREKALQEFSVHQSRESYLSSYLHILGRLEQENQLVAEEKTEFMLAHAVGETVPYELSSASQLTMTDLRVLPRQTELVAVGGGVSQQQISDSGIHTNLSFAGGTRADRASRRKLQLIISGKNKHWEPVNQEGIDQLASEILQRDSHPIDFLEVSALLESLGTTDEMAYHHYGAPNTFELAKVVLEAIRARQAKETKPSQRSTHLAGNFWQALRSYIQGPVAFLPGFIVLVIIQAYSFVGQWSAGQIMALSLGMSAGLLMTNGFLQASMRRASICLTLNNPRAARRFLLQSLGIAAICMVAMALLVLLVTTLTDAISFEERMTFCLAFVALSTIWLIGGPLSLVQEQVWLGVGLGTGLLAGFTVDRLISLFSDLHLVFGSISGFVIALAIILFVWKRAFALRNKTTKSERIILPSKAYLLYEATPYFAYGMLYAAFITIPHFLGWFGKLHLDQSRHWAVTSLEVGLTFAMPPLVLVGGFAERALRLFWLKAEVAQKATHGLETEQFGQTLLDFYRKQGWQYRLALGLFSLVYGSIIWIILNNGMLSGLVGPDPLGAILFFLAGLVIFYLIGVGVFNCMFCVTLARPGKGAQAVFIGILVLLAVGIPFSIGWNFAFCVAAFMIGALVFVKVSANQTRQVLKEADYYYFASF